MPPNNYERNRTADRKNDNESSKRPWRIANKKYSFKVDNLEAVQQQKNP